MPPPPTPPPFSLRLALKDLNLNVTAPVAVVLALILVGVPRALDAVKEWAVPAPAAQPEQRWTAGTGVVASVALAAVRGALPSPDPRQKMAPCDPEVGEEEINGACWIRLSVEKCNSQKAYPHNGKCYWRALRPAPLPREPTTGEPRPLGVADP